MGPFQPGEPVHVVILNNRPIHDGGKNDQPVTPRRRVYVFPATAIVLPDGRTIRFREGFGFRDANQAVQVAADIAKKIDTGELPPS